MRKQFTPGRGGPDRDADWPALDALNGRLEEARARFDALKAGAGDPEALEWADLDASDAFFISGSEDGDAVMNGPRKSIETAIPFSEDADSFVELAGLRRDWLEEVAMRIEEARARFDALKGGAGDPETLEWADLDASDAFFISESEDGDAVMNGPRSAIETAIPFSGDADSFVELAELRRDWFEALKALAGDLDKLEPSDLDASEDFTITESRDGDVVIGLPQRSIETGIAYSEDTDSFVELAEAARSALDDRLPGTVLAPDTPLQHTMFEWSLRDRLADVRTSSETEAPEPGAVPAAGTGTGATAADFTGAGQTVVVIDDGYSLFYDQSATVSEYDFAGWHNDPSARTTGAGSHGSWVAETVTDAASGVEIVHLKVFSDDGGSATMRDVEEALDFVIASAEHTDIAAVNLSLGYGNATEETTSLLSDEFAELDALGIFPVVAAGNAGATYHDGVNVLAADPNVIAVSAVDETDAFADFSQTSESLTDIAALGVDVGIETAWGPEGEVSGTSFAAPVISGIAARLQEAAMATIGEPLTDEEFLEILQASGQPVADATEAEGYRVADGDAAVEYFLVNADDYGDLLMA